jgi:hypothetical protein
MVITMQIYDGENCVPIETEELRLELQLLVDEAVAFEPDYCVLVHDRFPIFYNNTHIDHPWYQTLLPKFPVPDTVVYDQLEEKSYGLDCIYNSGALYIKLEQDLHFNKAYQDTYLKTMDIILSLYKRGTIVLDTEDTDFIAAWELARSDTYGTYHPTWINRWIAPQPTKFLLDRRAGTPYLSFTIPLNNVARHEVAILLTKYKFRFVFCDTEVLVWIRSIMRADRAHNLITKAIGRSRGEVRTDTDIWFVYSDTVPEVADPLTVVIIGNSYVEYKDLHNGVVRSVKV